MEQNSDTVASGRFISENTFTRKEHELRIGNIVMDYYDRAEKTIHEIKRSGKMSELHVKQVQYYMFILENEGIKGVKGVIHYPKERKKKRVVLTDDIRAEFRDVIKHIHDLTQLQNPPPVIDVPYCKSCAYYELCYS